MSFDVNKLMQQAAEMQEQVQKIQEQAAAETAEASAGGGMVIAIEISPEAIDPDDPEGLADLVLAGVNEALRAAHAQVEEKAQALMGQMGLGGLGLPGLGG